MGLRVGIGEERVRTKEGLERRGYGLGKPVLFTSLGRFPLGSLEKRFHGWRAGATEARREGTGDFCIYDHLSNEKRCIFVRISISKYEYQISSA